MREANQIEIEDLTPNIIEHPGIAYNTRDFGETRRNSTDGLFSEPRAVLKSGTPVQEGYYELQGILDNLQTRLVTSFRRLH